jgi:hypothetical protein
VAGGGAGVGGRDLGDGEDVAAGGADCVVVGRLQMGSGRMEVGGGRCVVGLGDLQSSISGAFLALRVSQQRRTKCLKVRGFTHPNSQNIGPAGMGLIRSGTSQGVKHSKSSEAAQVQEL